MFRAQLAYVEYDLLFEEVGMCAGIYKSQSQNVVFDQVDEKPVRFDVTFPESGVVT